MKFLLMLSLLFSSCALSPGMVYNEKAPEDGVVDSTSQFQNMQVRLRSITPQNVHEISANLVPTNQVPAELLALKPEAYRLGLYDVVTVTVWEHPELTLPMGQYRSDLASGQMVDEKGQIFYPYIGMVPAQGRTAGEMREHILGSLSTILNDPQLDVKVTGFRSQKVFVHGAVKAPCIVPVTDVPLTLLNAVNSCGGLSPDADASQVELQRQGEHYVVDLYAKYAQDSGPAQILLQDGDVLRVASRDENKVYVLGEVNTQAAVPLNNGKLSLVQALAEVGGLSPLSAQSKGIYVIRYVDSAKVEVFHLNARNPLALALGDQFALRPRDVVFVDATGLARWNRVIGLILPTAALISHGASTAADIHTITK